MTWLALGWQVGTLTGWGQFGAHFARTARQAGYRIILPPGSLTDLSGVLPLDRPLLQGLTGPIPETEPGWLCMAIGNGMEERPQMPPHVKVAGIIFCEDTGAIDAAKLNAYDLIVAGSRWTERVLKEKGVERVILAHQGYDSRVFFPHPQPPETNAVRPPASIPASGDCSPCPEAEGRMIELPKGRPLVFSGGKLEFRKGQDIVVEAFKRFRQTPEGKDAVLVTAWDNQWPKTMDGIWLSGYVKGVPSVRNGRADISSWLVLNGLPAESVIDCGRLSPPELAHVMRSCDVGIFPNRAESGTNLVLVEALASGLPVHAVGAHGHDDVLEWGGWAMGHEPSSEVPEGCPLYKSVEGWAETDPEWLATCVADPTGIAKAGFADHWSWEIRGPAMAEAITTYGWLHPTVNCQVAK